MSPLLLEKYEKLKEDLIKYKGVSVAFSSGVDSTFLLYAAHEALGDNALAITAESNSFPKRESMEARDYCKELGVKQLICHPEELQIEEFVNNPVNRCYICKKEIFTQIIKLAKEYNTGIVVEGSNLDDNGDYRPGHQAIKELGVKSPLRDCGFTKAEIRELSNYFNIPTWDKPSYACLASRFPYGEKITAEKLDMVDKAEQYIMDLGFRQVRVRIHDKIARIELLAEDMDRFMDVKIREGVYEEFKKIGFEYTALDLKGYRTGSLNENLKKKAHK
ncbi:MAG: ATP-dependent sacrificial sulfur transferase LarE [Lachnospiraceae bacterium]|nr:ATP-dependent sacrificial sulfur transferase LarE [Lachnospiraceae bacterium]